MEYRHFEKILQWVKKHREKYIIVFEDESKPLVLLPFENLEEFYEQKERVSVIPEPIFQSKKVSLTEVNTLDTIMPERIQEKRLPEAPPKPQLLREAIEERVRGEKGTFLNQTITNHSLEEKKKDEKIERVNEKDRYYFEPIE